MLMGLSDVLSLARTPEEREEMKAMILDLMDKGDEDIDYSDISEVTDFSGWRPAKPHFDRMAEHNQRVWREKEALSWQRQA